MPGTSRTVFLALRKFLSRSVVDGNPPSPSPSPATSTSIPLFFYRFHYFEDTTMTTLQVPRSLHSRTWHRHFHPYFQPLFSSQVLPNARERKREEKTRVRVTLAKGDTRILVGDDFYQTRFVWSRRVFSPSYRRAKLLILLRNARFNQRATYLHSSNKA